jgi:hypothetical protein
VAISAESVQFTSLAADSYEGPKKRCAWRRGFLEKSWQRSMWCKNCRQDVPGLANANSAQLACARCGAVLLGQGGPAHIVGVEEVAAHGVDLAGRKRAPVKPPLAIDEWEFDHDLRELQGLMAAAKAGQAAPLAPVVPAVGHLAHSSAAMHSGGYQTSAQSGTQRLRSPWFAWSVLMLGVLSFIGGGSLLGMAYAFDRDDLWTVGMPITIAGQVCLLLGLVLQIERLWQGSRYAADKLGEVDQRLADLNQATRMLGVTHGSASQAFYAHMSEGASPHLLMADLKGQLDLLAVRMSQRR